MNDPHLLAMLKQARAISRRLDSVLIDLPQDYTTDGNPDCSGGCKWFVELEEPLGADWGVCSNRRSHRAGLLTFEHQGCEAFEYGRREEAGE